MSVGSRKDSEHELLCILLGYILSFVSDLAHLEVLFQEAPPESPRQQVILTRMCSLIEGVSSADLIRGLKEPETYKNAAWMLAKLKNPGQELHSVLSDAMKSLTIRRLIPSLEKDLGEEKKAMEEAKRQEATRKEG